jgi:hypothetical protein
MEGAPRCGAVRKLLMQIGMGVAPKELTVGRFAPALPVAERGPVLSAAMAGLWAFLFVTLLMTIRPLEEWDDVYLLVLRYSIDPYFGMAVPQDALEYALAEYSWQLLVRFIFNTGMEFDTTFAWLSMAAVACTSFVLLRRARSPIVLLIFANPALMDFFISQVRSALAFSIMLLLIFRSLPVAVAGIVLAATFHTSMMLMVIPLAIEHARRRFASSAESAHGHFWPAVAAGFALVLVSFQGLILDFLGDRRAIYSFVDFGTGTMFTVGWMMVAAAFYLTTRSRSSLSGVTATFNIAMFLFSSIAELYAHRYIPFFLLFIAISLGGTETSSMRRAQFFAVFAAFSAVYFFFWL